MTHCIMNTQLIRTGAIGLSLFVLSFGFSAAPVRAAEIQTKAKASAKKSSPRKKLLRRAAIATSAALAIKALPLMTGNIEESQPNAWKAVVELAHSKRPQTTEEVRAKAIAEAERWKRDMLQVIGDPTEYLKSVVEEKERVLETFEGSPYLFHSREPHMVQFLSTGIQGMASQLELIRKSDLVALQYYFFDQSSTARIMLDALISRCKEDSGFRAQVLVDYYGWEGEPGLTPEIVQMVRERSGGQIEFKYFNDSGKAQFWNVGHRDHSKLMVGMKNNAGGEPTWTAIVGSANVGDESRFVANSYFMFQEAELKITGPIARTIYDRHYDFWTHKYSIPVPDANPWSWGYDKRKSWNEKLLTMDPQLRELRDRFVSQGAEELASSPTFVVNDLTWVSDRPGKDASDRVVNHYLLYRMAQAKNRVLLENYAALIPDNYWKVLLSLKAEGVPSMRIHTNGFDTEASDPRMPLLMLKHVRRAAAAGIDVYEFLGKPLPGQVFLRKKATQYDQYTDNAKDSDLKAGIHSKIWEFDDWTGIMTANFDPRSLESMRWGVKGANVEMGVFIHDQAFADHIAEQMQFRLKGAKQMDAGGLRYIDGTEILVRPDDEEKEPFAPVDQPGMISKKASGKHWWVFKIPFVENIF